MVGGILMQAQPAVILLCGLHCEQEWLPQDLAEAGLCRSCRRRCVSPRSPSRRVRSASNSARRFISSALLATGSLYASAVEMLPPRRVIGIGQHLLDERPPAPTGSRSPRLICGRSMRPMSRVRGDVCLICSEVGVQFERLHHRNGPGLQQLEDLRVVARHEQAELAGRAEAGRASPQAWAWAAGAASAWAWPA